MSVSSAALRAEILRQVVARGPDASICPSDVARALAVDWRPLLTPVRTAAAALSEAGEIEILRKGKPVPAQEMHGVIRLRVRP